MKDLLSSRFGSETFTFYVSFESLIVKKEN